MNEKTVGRLLILTAAVLWSTNGLFAKAPLFADWPTELDGMPVRGPLLAFWRALFAALVILPFVRRPRWRIQLVPMVLAYAAMNYTFLNALTLTNEANAIWLQNTAPMWVFLIGVLMFREPVHPRDGWLLACSVLGIGLILWFEVRGQSPIGVAYGLGGGITYAGVVLSLRYLRTEDGAWLMLLNNLVTAVLFFPFVLVPRHLAQRQSDAVLDRVRHDPDGASLSVVRSRTALRRRARGHRNRPAGADSGSRLGLLGLASRSDLRVPPMVDADRRRLHPAGPDRPLRIRWQKMMVHPCDTTTRLELGKMCSGLTWAPYHEGMIMPRTIEIDDAAYRHLEQARRPDEDWSALIRRCVRVRPSFEEVMQTLQRLDVSPETLDAIDDAVTRRRAAAPSRRTS
jgi:drug/metabolite transporter (DMT)-like permease/predicted CopG family antitoxin